MLKPQLNAYRELVDLDGLWAFKVDTDRTGQDNRWFATRLDTILEAPVPASYNDIFTDPSIRDHVGWVWYQRSAWVPRGWAGHRVVLRVDSATHEGLVYVNDTLVAQHVGGYTPFEADITPHVTPGSRFRLTIAVNNELTYDTIPPGQLEISADGHRTQRY